MFIEKKRKGVSPRLLTSNGGRDGVVVVADGKGFFVKQRVQIVSDAQPSITVEIKRFLSNNSFRVGPIGDSIHSKTDVSNYLVADSARISAEEQDRPGVPDKDYNRAVYAEEPIVAKRVIQVDENGNYYNQDNPLPVQFSVDSPLPVQISDQNTPQWDEFVTSFPSPSSELYTYKNNNVVVQTVLITYTSSSKKVISRIQKTRM